MVWNLWLPLVLLLTYQNRHKTMNSAFVFIKPHANTAPTQALVKEKLAASNINILSEGELTAEQIDAGRLIDQVCCWNLLT